MCIYIYLTLLVLSCSVGLNEEECSGRSRGECDCGQCTCYIQEELLRIVQALLVIHVMLQAWYTVNVYDRLLFCPSANALYTYVRPLVECACLCISTLE